MQRRILIVDDDEPLATVLTYATPWDKLQHLAIVFGDIGDGEDVPVRIHRERLVEDVFGKRRGVDQSLGAIAAAGRGVVLYLREGAAGVVAKGGAPVADGDGAEQEVDELNVMEVVFTPYVAKFARRDFKETSRLGTLPDGEHGQLA